MYVTYDDILRETAILADRIEKLNVIREFRDLECQVRGHSEINALLAAIPPLQKQAVQSYHYEKSAAHRQAEQELEHCFRSLNTYSLFCKYKESYNDANSVVQEIVRVFHKTLETELDKNN